MSSLGQPRSLPGDQKTYFPPVSQLWGGIYLLAAGRRVFSSQLVQLCNLVGSLALCWVSQFPGSWHVWAQEPAQTHRWDRLWEGRDRRSGKLTDSPVIFWLQEGVSVPACSVPNFTSILDSTNLCRQDWNDMFLQVCHFSWALGSFLSQFKPFDFQCLSRIPCRLNDDSK